MALFSGSAADLLASVGAPVPDQKPQSSLEDSQASKAAQETECHDPHCTEDHGHGSHEHSHAHGGGCCEHEGEADHEHGHAKQEHGHGHHEHAEPEHDAHAHAKDEHSHGHHEEETAAHGHSAHDCAHGHDSGQGHDGGHDGAHGHDSGHAHDAAHGSACSHDHGHDSVHAEHAEEHHIAKKLRTTLGATHVEVVDASDGCGTKLTATIVSTQFEGKPLPAQHRLVYSALEEEMKTIHALNIKTFTPKKWAARS